MKDYLNLFHGMIDKLHNWDDLTLNSKATILEIFLDNAVNYENLVDYFENYQLNLINNTLNSYIKGVIKH